jgi:hypothetical protein
MKIKVMSDIMDVSKGRHILLESVLWAMQLTKPWDRSERGPHI